MNPSPYEMLLKAIELGDVDSAANALGLPATEILRGIADIERSLDVDLIENRNGRVELTQFGVQLLPDIRLLVDARYDLRKHSEQLHSIDRGIVRIGTFSSGGCFVLAPLLAEFKKGHPQISFRIKQGDYAEIESWVAQGSVDCGLTLLPTTHEFSVMPAFIDRQLAVLPPDHRLAQSPQVPIGAFTEEPMIFMHEGTQREVAGLFRRQGLHPDIRYVVDDDYTILSMVEHGVGISILPECVLARASYDVVVAGLDPPTNRRIGLIMNDRNRLSQPADAFVEFFCSHWQYSQTELSLGRSASSRLLSSLVGSAGRRRQIRVIG